MAVNKIIVKVDGVQTDVIDFNSAISGLTTGDHTVEVQAFDGATLVASQIKNITVGSAVTYEAETIAYMTSVGIPDNGSASVHGITNNAVWVAIDTFIKSLKTGGVYSKLKAAYPFIGGSASTHKWNLINPLDTDSAFRLVFYGSGIHSATGFKGNGTNSYADTKLNQLSNMTVNSESFGVYSRTNLDEGKADIGLWDGVSGTSGSYIFTRFDDLIYLRNQTNSSYTVANTDSRGFFAGNRVSSSQVTLQKNATLSTNSSTSKGLINTTYLVGARGGYTDVYSGKELAYAFIGSGLTETQMAAHYNAVQQLQTTLNRAV